jgi:hypothetical protein
MRLPRPIDAATQAKVSTDGRRCRNPPSLQSPLVMSASLFVRPRDLIGLTSPDAPEGSAARRPSTVDNGPLPALGRAGHVVGDVLEEVAGLL